MNVRDTFHTLYSPEQLISLVSFSCTGPALMTDEVLITGTVFVILSDLSCKDGNVRFTMVPRKALSDQV